MDVINFDNVQYTYPSAKKPIIDDLSLAFPKGQWTGIIGHNGSGKSTIARLIDGLLLPQAGEIKVNGLPVVEKNLAQVHQLVGIVFQNPDNQFVGTTVADDVAFGLENRQISPKEMPGLINRSLAAVGMQKMANYEPSRLSGGQKQRVAIAGILALKPQILILDEATSMLDPAGRQLILDLLNRLRRQTDLTIISITHDANEMEMTDRLVVLDQGRVVRQGPTKKVLSDDTLFAEYEISMPVSQQLRRLLVKRGFNLPNRYLTKEEMAEWLHQQLG